jgi:hypothetical protein
VIAPVETCNTVRGDLLEKPVALWGFVLLGRNNMPTSAVCVAGFSAPTRAGLPQAWQKYLISGIDRYRCQNRKVLILSIKYRFLSIPGTQFPPLIAINFRTTSLIRKLLVAQIFYLI